MTDSNSTIGDWDEVVDEGPADSRESCHFWESRTGTCHYEMLVLGCQPCADCTGDDPDHVYILHDHDPRAFAAGAVPRVFGSVELAQEAAAGYIAAAGSAEWLPVGIAHPGLVLKCDGRLTSVTIRRMKVER